MARCHLPQRPWKRIPIKRNTVYTSSSAAQCCTYGIDCTPPCSHDEQQNPIKDRCRKRHPLPVWIRTLTLLLFAVALHGCSTPQALKIRVKPSHDAGVQYPPEELARMITDLGYQQLRVEDPVTQQSVTVGEKYGEYRLLFQSLENNHIHVDVHVVQADGHIALYFYDRNQGTPGDSGLRLYEQLVERVRFEYGDAHVHASQP